MGKGREFWHSHVEGWLRSGLSQRAYSEREGLSSSGLKYWSSKLGGRRRRARGLVEVSRGVARGTVAEASRAIELVVAGRYLLRLPPGTAREDLENVLAAVERRS